MNRAVATLVAIGLFAHQSDAYILDSANAPAEPPTRSAPLTPLELLANDKEARSILVKKSTLSEAKPRLEEVAKLLASEIFEKPQVCETGILTSLEKLNSQISITKNPRDLKSILISLRENNLIDDILLLPLMKALPAYLAFSEMKFEAPTRDLPGASQPETSPALTPPSPEVVRALKLFRGADHRCPTDAYTTALRALAELKTKPSRKDFLAEIEAAAALGVISPTTTAWLTELHRYKWDETPFTLGAVAPKVATVKNVYLAEKPTSQKTGFASKKVKKSGGLTRRMILYRKFTADQMKAILLAFYRFDVAYQHGKKLEVSIYDSENELLFDPEVITEPATIYRAAVRILHHELVEKLSKDPSFSGVGNVKIDFEDAVMAGLETGFIDGIYVNRVHAVKDVWSTTQKPWEKVMKVAKKVVGYGVIFIPPPYNMIGSITIALVEGLGLTKNKKNADPLTTGLSIF